MRLGRLGLPYDGSRKGDSPFREIGIATPKFRLEISYSETTGDPVAAYVRVREGKVTQTKEIKDGVAFTDYGADGALLGIELLEPCRLEILEGVVAKESEQVRQFLRLGVRKEMICA